ncbi:hypothetical protein QVD17_35848 [Tagetes erecta]|uniref:Uncharacterized protein n=1 Tax=Tagetes erecta TaxID=13708 RepID=A0AAD8NHL0_TARER|nr:hypothetical protein QVD17_35848 [Tagetes erecta]
MRSRCFGNYNAHAVPYPDIHCPHIAHKFVNSLGNLGSLKSHEITVSKTRYNVILNIPFTFLAFSSIAIMPCNTCQ